MGIVTVDKNTGNNFVDNQAPDDMSFTSSRREFHPPHQSKLDYRAILALTASGCVSFVLLWIVYGFWKLSFCWNRNYDACQTITNIEPLVFAIVFGCVMCLAVWSIAARILAYIRQTQAITNRTNLTLTRFGDQFPADFFTKLDPDVLLKYIQNQYQIANDMQCAVAPYQIYKGVNSLSNSNQNAAPMLPELIDVDETIKPIAADEWITWVNQRPHIILAGATGRGKTVTAKPIIAPRIENNEQICVIDPHSDHWFGLDVIGGGENWAEIKDVLAQITAEYQSRQQAREVYRRLHGSSMPVALFKRLTVVMDEGFLCSLHTNTAPRGQISVWDQFIEVLGSGARKINISVVMLSQTANVEDLGVSGPLRENFTRIAVDNRAIKLMIKNEESNTTRKQLLYDALIGMAYPAVTVVDTSVVLLDRTGLDSIPDPRVTPANHYPFVRLQGASNGHNGDLHTDGRNGHNIIDRLRVLRLSGVSREEARDDLGLVFSNEDWTLAQ